MCIDAVHFEPFSKAWLQQVSRWCIPVCVPITLTTVLVPNQASSFTFITWCSSLRVWGCMVVACMHPTCSCVQFLVLQGTLCLQQAFLLRRLLYQTWLETLGRQWQPTSLFKGAGGVSLIRPSSVCIGSWNCLKVCFSILNWPQGVFFHIEIASRWLFLIDIASRWLFSYRTCLLGGTRDLQVLCQLASHPNNSNIKLHKHNVQCNLGFGDNQLSCFLL